MNSINKIDFMIIGAQKAGTTSLNNYLCQHPEINGHATLQTEFAYFWDDTLYEKNFDELFKKCFGKNSTNNVLAKNAALYNNNQALKRLHQHNKDCKLIFIMREPISRAYSSYAMEIFGGWFKEDFSEIKTVLEKDDKSDAMYRFFIEPSLYVNHLKNIYKYFPKEQVKIFLFEDLKTNPNKVCKEIFDWLEVDSSFKPEVTKTYNETKKAKSKILSKIILKLKGKNNIIKKFFRLILPYSYFKKLRNSLIESNKSSKKIGEIKVETKDYLKKYFQPFNIELQELTGIDLKEKWNH